MAQRARIEEVSDSDSDPVEMDPSDFDPTQFANSLISPPNIPQSGSSTPPEMLQSQFRAPSAADTDNHKHWQCLYPLYFDKARSRAEGRRVGQDMAVTNPLAREIVDAVQLLGLNVAFEPGKLHPKDWSNPGRVRVLIKEDGRIKNPQIRNKHHLYTLVSKHLLVHPTTNASPMRLRIANMPAPTKPTPPVAIPRGWKMGTILPLHSPALSGGGVSEDFFKEMLAEMQGQQGQGQVQGSAGGEGKKKKEKKKMKG
ncbi:MAG: signal recognition particle subunit [Pycnora praestabilis]|nr:MAG: signal recognition particle subunit [Pycnora praestabilis]